MARKSHKDVEFMVSHATGTRCEEYFRTFDKAAAWALQRAVSGAEVNLDVLISSHAGAKWYGGSDAAERYREDPDASVFERFEIRVNCAGSVS